jgi:hypothetical protein
MMENMNIRDHMEVLGSDGKHVGTVDHMEGTERIKLAKNDPKAEGMHHFIPVGWVDHVDSKVHLNKSSDFATTQWQGAA